jgi:hypothetical protein
MDDAKAARKVKMTVEKMVDSDERLDVPMVDLKVLMLAD